MKKTKKKINKEQRVFNAMMNHLFGSIMMPIFFSFIFSIVVQSIFSISTANLAFDKYNCMYTPFDGVVDKICNGFTTICVIIAIPFFIKGLFIMKKYIEITKKEA